MAYEKWIWLEDQQPDDLQDIWVRIGYWNYPPFRARWYADGRAAQSDTTGIIFYDYQISKWKPVI